MRRKDREVTSKQDLIGILDQCTVCRIAMIDHGIPYLVPMNFGYEIKEDHLFLYFHCAKQGRKIEILKENPGVCFEMDCEHQLLEVKTACAYSYAYASLIGNGVVSFLEDAAPKKEALARIMEQQTGRQDFSFDDHMLESVTVFQIISHDYTGKRRTLAK